MKIFGCLVFCQSIQKGNGVRKDPVFLLLFFMCSNHSCFAEQNMKVFAVGTLQI